VVKYYNSIARLPSCARCAFSSTRFAMLDRLSVNTSRTPQVTVQM